MWPARLSHERVYHGTTLFTDSVRSHIERMNRIHDLKLGLAELSIEVANRRARVFAMGTQDDKDEKRMRQAIAEVKGTVHVKVLQIEQDQSESGAVFSAFLARLDTLRAHIEENGQAMAQERERILRLARCEFTAADYDEQLRDTALAGKRLLAVENSAMTVKAQVALSEDEVEKTDVRIRCADSKIRDYTQLLQRMARERTENAVIAETLAVEAAGQRDARIRPGSKIRVADRGVAGPREGDHGGHRCHAGRTH